jgi:hypothetical protein
MCGCSSMAEHQLPKLTVGVRFPSPAPHAKAQVTGSTAATWAFIMTVRFAPTCCRRAVIRSAQVVQGHRRHPRRCRSTQTKTARAAPPSRRQCGGRRRSMRAGRSTRHACCRVPSGPSGPAARHPASVQPADCRCAVGRGSAGRSAPLNSGRWKTSPTERAHDWRVPVPSITSARTGSAVSLHPTQTIVVAA